MVLTLLAAALLAATIMLSACGSGGSSASLQNNVTLSGNWQFTMASPADGSFFGGLQGGFLQQSSRSLQGTAAYAVSLSQLLIPCSSGYASITGTISGQSVTLTASAGTQTFTFAGTLSFDGSTMIGTYSSTAGTSSDGAPCGTAQSGLQWSAIFVPPITGAIQGSFHSAGGAAGLTNQDFPVSGSLTQTANSGGGSATAAVTGALNFISPSSNTDDYPCLSTASVSGQISGNSVILQIIGAGGSILGAIGEPLGPTGVTGVDPVTFNSAHGGYILNALGPSYLLATVACPGSVDSITAAGDYGYLCLSVGSPSLGTTTACQEAITLAPASLTFPAQKVGTTATQMITISNTSGAALNGMTLGVANDPANAANFSETDNCGLDGAPSLGTPFYFPSGQSCAITVMFTPQCGSECASPLTGTLTATSPVSADDDTAFAVPITGTGK